MGRVLDNRKTHALVLQDDGETELIPWSDYNKLAYKHGLSGLLVDRDEHVQLTNDEYAVTISPDMEGDREVYGINLDRLDADWTEYVTVAEHDKSDLLDALLVTYETNPPDPQPLVALAAEILDYAVNPRVVDQLTALDVFDDVDVQSDGWLIHDHVLLTYDNQFYHPNTDRAKRDGTVLDDSANKPAYEVRFQRRPEGEGQLELDGFTGLGTTDDMVEFVTRALWAVTYTPEDL
jgi:hypothetical protein